MRMDQIHMLQETLHICRQGYYMYGGKRVDLKLSPDEMQAARVFLPDEIAALADDKAFKQIHVLGRCGHSCENMDAFALARHLSKKTVKRYVQGSREEILVLNMADPVTPGGSVRRGGGAQEQDLCRNSSLLLSLESRAAEAYYRYNRSLHTDMASDAVIISPYVEIIRDENGELLEESVIAAVMTCAAPCLRRGLGGLTQKQYADMMYGRIVGMLRCAAALGYRHLVLGAFGCGVFQNDPEVVSDLFYKALKEFDLDNMKEKDLFDRIDFAVLDTAPGQYNFKAFYRNFGDRNFFFEENYAERLQVLKRRQALAGNLDPIRGVLAGGAIGDALGYPAAALSADEIAARYGARGITAYEREAASGKAQISAYTQVTLFMANGILANETRECTRSIGGILDVFIQMAYRDWQTTQEQSYAAGKHKERNGFAGGVSWLLDVPELYSRRDAAGRKAGENSGGIGRMAPLGIRYENMPMEALDREAAGLAALTDPHPLEYLPSAVTAHILHRIVFDRIQYGSLKDIVLEARDMVCDIFNDRAHIDDLFRIIDDAVALAENGAPDGINIRRLGAGRAGEEILAIALYCALRYEHDFSGGIIAAVNHGGDSAAVGALTGSILGALAGYAAIDDRWKRNLELLDVVLEMADDLCYGCPITEYGSYYDPDWGRKYLEMHWKAEVADPIFFWHENEEYGCFSNWYPGTFVVDDFCYIHVEQYLMAQKARLFHDAAAYTAILKETSPKVCKRLGREVKPFDADVWEQARYAVLKTGIRAKFTQNEDLKRKLLETGDSILAEASPYDGIFGIRMAASEASLVPPSRWPGRNLLGKALMEIRDELRSGA